MSKLLETYLRYGVPSNIASKFEAIGLSVSTFRATPIQKLIELYNVSSEEASYIKKCITRQPIQEEVIQKLLESSNFVCCCCKGIKSDSYIIHHIVEYEISQDNSYENLVVLCPNDHDLAHRTPSLTNKLTENQIRKSKDNWEQQVQLHNLAISKHGEREKFLLKLPQYEKLESEIFILKERISDKEKLITRSEAFFNEEISKLRNQIVELETQKTFLVQQVQNTVQKLTSTDLNNVSKLYSKAVSLLLNADLSGAIRVLDEAELDHELAQFEKIDEELNESLRKNAESRIFKAKLLTLDFRFSEARQSAGQGLELYERLADRNPEKYLLGLAFTFESVGTIYYNTGIYEAAEECFINGLSVCQTLQEMEIHAYVPLYALLLQSIGASYYSREEYETAKQYLEEANLWYDDLSKRYQKYRNLNDIPLENQETVGWLLSKFEYGRALAATNLGATYNALGMHDKALELVLNGKNAYENLIDKNNSTSLDAFIKSSLGSSYHSAENFVAAKEAYLKLLPIVKGLVEKNRTKHIEELADLLLNICNVCLKNNELDDAQDFCSQALHLYREFAIARGERAEIQMASALMYLIILSGNDQKNDSDKWQMANEVKFICEKYLNNSEAKQLLDSALLFLKLGDSAEKVDKA